MNFSAFVRKIESLVSTLCSHHYSLPFCHPCVTENCSDKSYWLVCKVLANVCWLSVLTQFIFFRRMAFQLSSALFFFSPLLSLFYFPFGTSIFTHAHTHIHTEYVCIQRFKLELKRMPPYVLIRFYFYTTNSSILLWFCQEWKKVP